ncbi:MAG TPA: polymorphic toxin-type HINT domain-containing protein, partial [Agitococcus sp.]|nr:polymorphic toxin-type HINT domain-containing protein [Agitococcus sp.]
MSKEVSASGFVAGTLVHTDKGLVPIEQLKVGDMVLSKHESGEGEQAYKRVVNTFKSAEKLPIVSVSFNDLSNRLGSMRLFCTDNHPFWNPISKEWTPAKDLRFNSHVVLYDLNDKIVGLDDDA